MSQNNKTNIENIEKHFKFLLEKKFFVEINKNNTQDWIVRFHNENCQITFIEDRNELFITLQTKAKTDDKKSSNQLFELEVIIAYLTKFKIIIRGTKRNDVLISIEEQIKYLGNIFASYQDQILYIFDPDAYLKVESELIDAKDKIDNLYIQYIKSASKE